MNSLDAQDVATLLLAIRPCWIRPGPRAKRTESRTQLNAAYLYLNSVEGPSSASAPVLSRRRRVTSILLMVSVLQTARRHYKMETFEISEMDPFVILIFLFIVAATLLAQLGFLLIANDVAKYQRTEHEGIGDVYAE